MAKQPVYWQTQCKLPAQVRGFHLITPNIEQILANMPPIATGLVHLFLQHTSASLTISENISPEVAEDLEAHFNRVAPDDKRLYQHIIEGEDDMPAHIKNVILGVSLTLPLHDSRLALGRWQGIYLCEHRNQALERQLIITGHGIGV